MRKYEFRGGRKLQYRPVIWYIFLIVVFFACYGHICKFPYLRVFHWNDSVDKKQKQSSGTTMIFFLASASYL